MIGVLHKIALASLAIPLLVIAGCRPAGPLRGPASAYRLRRRGGRPSHPRAKFPACRSRPGPGPTAHRWCSTARCQHPADRHR